MKKIPAIFAMVSLTGMMVFVAVQSDKIEDLKYSLKKTSTSLIEAKDELKDTQDDLETTLIEKEELEIEVARLQTEIAQLQNRVNKLEKELAEYKESIANLRNRIQKLEKNLKTLKKEIEQLKQENGNNWKKINALNLEKEKLEQEIQYHLNKEIVIEEVQQETIEEVSDIKEQTDELNTLREFITTAMVDFGNVGLWKHEDGGVVRKVKYNDKKWKFTNVQMSLHHPDEDYLMEQEFVLKILDLDTGNILPYNESNPQYPGGKMDTDGYSFTYDGNLAEVLYYNNEVKQSLNYELRVYVRVNGEDMPLKNGKFPLIQHGKPVTNP